jgi:hypothetical protein
MIPQEFIDEYKLTPLIENGYIYAEVRKGMYGLPQAGKIAQDRLASVLAPFGYAPANITAGLWTHKTRPINFTLVVDDFGIKYQGKEHADHLIAALQTVYKITQDWTGGLYIGIKLKWDYDKRTVRLSMPGYVQAALHKFQHPVPSRPQDSPYPWTAPRYGHNSQDIHIPEFSPLLPQTEQTRLQQLVGTFLYYARALDNTMLMALNSLASQQNKSTEQTAKEIVHFLNYCATHPEASILFSGSDMILYFYSDASFMSEPGARSRYGGYFFFGPKFDTPPKHMPKANGPIHVECGIMRNVLASAMESEMGGLFKNCQKGAELRITAIEMGHDQPPTPVATDNSAAEAVLNGTAKQRKSRAVDMRFYWVRDRIRQGHFHIFWEAGKINRADYYTKHHATSHHRQMRPLLLHPTATDLLNAQDKRLHYQRGCAETGTGLRSRVTSSSSHRSQVTGNPGSHTIQIQSGAKLLAPHNLHK